MAKKPAKFKVPAAPERLAAFRNGVDAETQAAAHLAALGFEVVATRYRSPCGEIDLIVQQGRLVVFVEVKARRKIDDAAYAVTPRQQKRIIAAAQVWLADHPEAAAFDLRFDAMLIAPGRAPRHLIAAFDASE